MDRSLLEKLYPLELLTPEGRKALANGTHVQSFQAEDYIYRLWEETRDMMYVLEGKIQVLYVGQSSPVILSHTDEAAHKPFTHGKNAIEAAIALEDVKILRLDYSLFSKIFSQESHVELELEFRAPEAEPESQPVVANDDFEPLELPDLNGEPLQLKQVHRKPDFIRQSTVARKKAPAPGKPQRSQPATRKAKAPLPPATRKPQLSRAPSPAPVPPKARCEPAAASQPVAKPAVQSRPVEKRVSAAEPKEKKLESLIQRLKHELTVERTLNLNLLKKQSKAAPPPPVEPIPEPQQAPAEPKTQTAVQTTVSEQRVTVAEVEQKPKAVEPPAVSRVEPETEVTQPKELSEIDQYMLAMTLYREENWESAHAAFQDLFISNPTTNLYQIYAARCSEALMQRARQGN